MPVATSSRFPSPESLHPALWRAHQLGQGGGVRVACASGFAALDAELPGGGWPQQGLTELLLPHPGLGEMRLLAPSLLATQQQGRWVMLFDPPAALSAWALMQWGLDAGRVLIVRSDGQGGSQTSWALEQALQSGHAGALLAWLPRLRAERLRRLQLAAHGHAGPAFVLREAAAMQQPSAAPLRLGLRADGPDALLLTLLKRRGPPLAAPIRLALPPVLSAAARQRSHWVREPDVPTDFMSGSGHQRSMQERAPLATSA